MIENNPSICAAPWVHLFSFGDEKIYPCCKSTQQIGDLSKNTFKEIYNSSEIKKIRSDMLKGKKVSSCDLCYKNEARWNDSFRKVFLRKYSNILKEEIKNTSEDGTVNSFNVKWLDLRFSNLCNFKCIMCSGFYSSAWLKDEEILNRFDSSNTIRQPDGNRNYFNYINHQIPDLVKTVEKINFAGGEPFLIKEYITVLEEFIKAGRQNDVEIAITTNLSLIPPQYIKILKNFKKLTIRASLDGIGERGEYIRKGLSWKKFLDNRFLLLKELPQSDIRVYSTVQILNVYHILDMYEYLIKNKIIVSHPNKFHLSFVDSPQFLNIKNLDKDTKSEVISFYENRLKNYPKEIKEYLYRIVLLLKDEGDDFSKEFKIFIEQIDNIRLQNCRDTFPELKNYFDRIDLISKI